MDTTSRPCFVQLPLSECEEDLDGFKKAIILAIIAACGVVLAAVVTGIFSLVQKKTEMPATASAHVTINIMPEKARGTPPLKPSECASSTRPSSAITAPSKPAISSPEFEIKVNVASPTISASKSVAPRPIIHRQGSVTFYRPFGASLNLHKSAAEKSDTLTVMDEGQIVRLDESISDWLFKNNDGKPCVWVWVSTTDANAHTWWGWCAASFLRCEEENGPIERRMAELRHDEELRARRSAVPEHAAAPMSRLQIHETQEGGAHHESWSTPYGSGERGSYWYHHTRSVSYQVPSRQQTHFPKDQLQ